MNKVLLLSLISIVLSADLDLEQVRADMLAKHNEYRQRHNVGNLVRSSAVETVAQNYANYLVTLGTMKHSDSDYGENLYWGLNLVI